MEDVQDKRILVQRDDLGHDYLLENDIGSQIVTVRDWEGVLPALLEGKADCAVMGMVQGVRLLQEEGYDGIRVLSQPLVQRPYSIAVQEGDAELLALVNEGLNLLKTSGQYDEIYQKWFGIYAPAPALDQKYLRFLAGVSHELRTPLHGILSMTDLVQSTDLTSKQSELVGRIKSASHQLKRVLSDLIEISRLDAGKLSLHEAPFALEELAEWIEPIFAEKAQEKALGFELNLQPSRHTIVVFDKERVVQIILNLADNAFKNTDSGEVTVTIRFEDSEVDGQSALNISVSDTGRGIAPEDQERIFSAFTQVSATSGELVSGLGLGLSIVRSITDLVGGSLNVTSAPGRGSTFWVRLPVRKGQSTPPSADGRANHDSAMASEGLEVLVAEDEAINRLYLQQILTRRGWSTTTVPDGEKAVTSVESRRYDLILMDLSMPRLGGLEATRKIRTLESAAGGTRMRIIALTAHAYEEHRQICLDAGMDGFVSKPVAAPQRPPGGLGVPYDTGHRMVNSGWGCRRNSM